MKKQHQWGFVANSKYGDLCQCQIETCKKWMFANNPKKLFTLSWDEVQGMHNRGEIDATETLGEPTNLFLIKPNCHKGITQII